MAFNLKSKALSAFKKTASDSESANARLAEAVEKSEKITSDKELSTTYFFISGNLEAIRRGSMSAMIRGSRIEDYRRAEKDEKFGKKNLPTVYIMLHDPLKYVADKEAKAKPAPKTAPKKEV